MIDVVGVGCCAVDFVGVVPAFPRPDTKNRMRSLSRQGGGLVATGLVALARLGASVSYMGKLGSDELSSAAIDGLTSEGVDVSHIVRQEGTGPFFAFVLVDEETGSRTIMWTGDKVTGLEKEELDAGVIASARFLFVDDVLVDSALAAVGIAREAGVKVVLDAENPDKPGIEKLIGLTDVAIVPEDFAFGFTGIAAPEPAARELLRLGPGVVVLTAGARGSLCVTGERTFHQPAFDVEVVDTTGCGDVFHGAFIYGMLRDWPLEAVAEFAGAVAALKCLGIGGRASIPRLEEAREFLLRRGSAGIKGVLRGR